MSRIEKAMEVARQLREQNTELFKDNEVENISISTYPQSVADEIKIESPRLVAANDFNIPIAEEFRKLKSLLAYTLDDGKHQHTLMVTSSISGEGKSVTALNLAISLAQEYDKHVTLVDTDLRNPSICRYLGLQRKKGLSNCLMEGIDVKEVLLDTGLGHLILLPAGNAVANPVELLSSQKMKDLFLKLKNISPNGYIVLDTSPVLPFAEPRIISAMVDGVIFVVKEGGTSLENIAVALESLNNSNILGLVYNKATTEGMAGGYHYYNYNNYKYGSYGYGYGSENQVPTDPPATIGSLSRIWSKFKKLGY